MFDDSQAGLSIVQIDGQWHRLLPHNELDILSAIGGGPGTILVDEHGVAEPIINGRATLVPGKSYKSMDSKDPIRGAQSRRIREHAAQQNIHVELGIDKLEALMPHLHHDTKPQTGGQNELNTPKEVLEYLIKVGIMRANLPVHRAIYAGVMTGLFIGIGSLLSISAGGGLNSAYVKENFPGLPRLVQGLTFPIALMLVIGYGGELFTGNTMYCLLALLRGKIKWWQLARNWFLSFFSNLGGCIFFAYFLGYLTDLYISEPYLSFIRGIGEKKVSIGFGVSFLRGVGANACVCLAVFLALISRDWTGRLIAMWWPIFTFVAIGYEHCVANMFFVPLAIFYGGKLTTAEFIYKCLIPSTLGNIVGGGILIGASAYFLYPSSPAPNGPASSDQAKNDKLATIPPSSDKGLKSSDKNGAKGEKGINFVIPAITNFFSSDRFSQDVQLATKTGIRASNDRDAIKSNAGANYHFGNNEFFSDVDGGLMIYYERYRTKSGKEVSVAVEGNIMVEDGRPTAMLAVVYPTSHKPSNHHIATIVEEAQAPTHDDHDEHTKKGDVADHHIINVHTEDAAEEKILLSDGKRSSIMDHGVPALNPSGTGPILPTANNNNNNNNNTNTTNNTTPSPSPRDRIVDRSSAVPCHDCSLHQHRHGAEFRGVVVMRLSDDRIIHCDDNFCELVGYSRRELLNMTLTQITYPDDIKIMRENIQHKINRFSRRIGGFTK